MKYHRVIVAVAVMLIAAVMLTLYFLLPEPDAPDMEPAFSQTDNRQDVSPQINTPAPDTQPPLPRESGLSRENVPPFHIRIAFTGDVLLYGNVARQLEGNKHDAVIDPELATLLSGTDLTFVNLEMAISERGKPAEDKQFTFRGKPDYLSLLTDTMGVSAVSLANNHSLDYGMDAFLDTMSYLTEAGIGYAGAGQNLDEAKEPWTAEVQGRSVALLAASRVIPVFEWNATDTRPGMLTTYDPENLNKAIADASKEYDYVVVFVHWGVERAVRPEDYQVKLARGYIDAGADVVIGAHPHVLQGFEIYKGKPIAYSLGNFIFTTSQSETCVAVFNITEDEQWLEIIPCTLASPYTSLVTDTEKIRARLDRLAGLSDGVGFDGEGRLTVE